MRLITNIAPVHLEGVGGNLEGVARAKGELFATAAPGDVCVVNADDERVSSLRVPPGCEVLSFGAAAHRDGDVVDGASSSQQPPDVMFDDVQSLALREVNFTLTTTTTTTTTTKCTRGSEDDDDGARSHHRRQRVTISEPGVHLAANAAAAAAVATALGVSLCEACPHLSTYQSLEMRMRVHSMPSRGMVCIDDAYNASPTSVFNALRTLHEGKDEGGRTVVFLGDMLELGAASKRYHDETVDACLDFGFDLVGVAGGEFSAAVASAASRGRDTSDVVVGEDAEGLWEKVKDDVFFTTADEDAAGPPSSSTSSSSSVVVLVKGSRGMKMDFVVSQLLTEYSCKK